MIGSIFFIYNRLVEIVFLIPIIGMLAYFIDAYQKTNQITPVYVLVLFIVSVIAIFWCLDTLIRLKTTKRSAIFVVFVDLLFFGAFIASVYELRFIATANCNHWDGGSDAVYKSLGPFGLHGEQTGNPLASKLNKSCAMLKASFAMGIMETIFFMWTAILAFFLHLGHRGENGGDATGAGIGVAYRGRHGHGHGHRRRSHSSRRGNRHSGSRVRSSSGRPHYVV